MNLDPSNPNVQPGMTFEEHQRIVQAALQKMNLSQEEIPDVELLLTRFFSTVNEVYRIVNANEALLRISGAPYTKIDLVKETNTRFLDRFVNYNKDELLIILASISTEKVVREIM